MTQERKYTNLYYVISASKTVNISTLTITIRHLNDLLCCV